jgi:pyruvate dehydrogenase E2 component (dihydrolipoamide acetyltransferase)
MAKDIRLPNLGEGVKSAQVTTIMIAVGDTITIDQGLIEMETDKASMEIPSTVAGTVTAIHVNQGDDAKPGDKIISVDEAAATAPAESAPEPEPAPEPAKSAPAPKPAPVSPAPRPSVSPAPLIGQPSRDPASVPASPAVRRFAREIGVDITKATGTGPGGRITEDDVKALSRTQKTSGGMSLAAKALPDFSRWGDVDVTPMSNLRKAAAGHLSHAWNAIPHVTQFDQADVTDLEVTRKAMAKRVATGGGKLTVTAILLKVVAHALRKFPQFNASVDMANHSLILKQYINIGLAVDTPRGLIVPVIRDVDQKNVTQLAAELATLSVRARDGKTSIDEMQGGTFTISNLGGIGGTNFTPIVNWPEVAILGVSRGSVQAVHQGDAFVPRTIMPVSLSYDHRIIDGADGARFLRWIAEALENPLLLALEG